MKTELNNSTQTNKPSNPTPTPPPPPEGEGNRYAPPPSRGSLGGGWGICQSSIKLTIS